MPRDFDSNLEAAGTFGRAQFLLIALNFYINAYIGWQAYIPVFVTRDVKFYCDQSSANKSMSSGQSGYGSEAEKDSFIENGFYGSDVAPSNGSVPAYGDECTKGCQSYVYDSKISSVVSEFDLACGDQNLLPSLSISAYWVAFLISCFISGALSDRFGRKYVSLTLIICFAVATSLTPLANDIYTYIGLRFACGFCAISSYLDYIIMAEMMDKNKLSMIGMTVEGSVLK